MKTIIEKHPKSHPQDYKSRNFINGRWIVFDTQCCYDQLNPADLSTVTGRWPTSSRQETQQAIVAAQQAFDTWNSFPVQQRADYFKQALQVMQQRVDTIAAVITAENGKTLNESRMEILSAIKEMEYQVAEGIRLTGEVIQSEQDGVLAFSQRRSLGVVAIIAPWNFPFNVPCRKVTPALMAGNTCVFKPANLTPGVGAEFVKIFDEVGLPAGVLNFVTGSGSVVGEEMVVNPTIKAISFTGSTEVGMGIEKKAATNLTRTQLEMGGKNPLVVLADADLAAAADAAVLAAFACAGQWCTSTSRVIVEQSIQEEFLDLLVTRVKNIVVGKGTDPQTTMGPVCGESQLKGILDSIEKGKAEGAHLLIGGRRLTGEEFDKGCFIEPTVFTEVTPEMYLAQEEIFGPVLSMMTAQDFAEAVEKANDTRFGLSSTVYTNDLKKALTFVEQSDVGLTHVNIPTAYKEPQLSFGGIKLSGCGIPEGGHSGIEFFTEHKVAYIKYR